MPDHFIVIVVVINILSLIGLVIIAKSINRSIKRQMTMIRASAAIKMRRVQLAKALYGATILGLGIVSTALAMSI